MQKSSDILLLKQDILKILVVAQNREEPVILSPQGKPVSMFCNIINVDDDYVDVANTIPAQMLPYVLSANAFHLLFRRYWVKFDQLISHGQHIRIPIAEFGEMEQSRTSERICFSEKENVRVKLRHPYDPATSLWRRVFDLSSGGMSFRARMNTPFIQPNRQLPSLKIYVRDTLREEHRGRVVYVRQIIDVKGKSYFQVGVQFVT